MSNTLEEALLLAAANSTATENPPVVIENDLRTVTLPSNFLLGVYNDKDVNDVVVEMPRYYKELDLSPFAISVNFIGADGTGDRFIVTNRTVGSDKITFHWLVGRNAFLADGTAVFAFCLRLMSGSTVSKEFNTTVTRVPVLEGLETDITPTPEQQSAIDAAISAMQDRINDMDDALDEMEENISHYPKIVDDYWQVWDAASNSWVETGVRALGEVTEQELTDKLALKADVEGSYPDLASGVSKDLIGDKIASDKEAYFSRKTKHNGFESNVITGGTVAWNQLVQNGNFENADNWDVSHSTVITASASNNILSVSVNADGDYRVLQSIDIIEGHKYLWAFDAKSETANSRIAIFYVGNTSTYKGFTAIDTNWHNYATVISCAGVAYRQLRLENSHANTTNQFKNVNVFDLTSMFGSTIADYIYSLEQATEGAGVEWFKRYFPNVYYPYDAGTLKSVNDLQAHVTNGFNQWDEEWELGWIDANGANREGTDIIRSKNFIPVLPNTKYFINYPALGTVNYYDADKNCLGQSDINGLVDVPIGGATRITHNNCYFIRIWVRNQTIYKNNICINISNEFKNGTYEPYAGHSYPLDPTLELRGIPVLKNGDLKFNGDVYHPNGVVERRYGIVDLGALSWSYNSAQQFFATYVSDMSLTTEKLIVNGYTYVNNKGWALLANGEFGKVGNQNQIRFHNDAYTDTTAFKSAMSGVYLVYELAAPTTEQAKPYNAYQKVSTEGIEFYETSSLIPILTESTYYEVKPVVESDKIYTHLTSGSTEQLLSKSYQEDQVPYRYRSSAATNNADRLRMAAITGGTVVWNQIVPTADKSGSRTPSGSTTYDIFQIIGIPIKVDHVYFAWAKITYNGDRTDIRPYMQGYALNYVIGGTQRLFNAGGIDHTMMFGGILNSSHDSGTFSVALTSNNVISSSDTWSFDDLMIVDLTQAFGSAIANYVAAIASTNYQNGVDWFKKLFPKDYYPYDKGTLKSVEGLISHDTVGFNQWDEETELGTFDNSTGQKAPSNASIRSKNYIRVLPNTVYYIQTPVSCRLFFYDNDKNFIEFKNWTTRTFTTPSNCAYMLIRIADSYGTTYNHDICINISNESKNGTYKPYAGHSYPLDPALELRGIPVLENGELKFNGDIYNHDGTVERRYGIVDLGTLTWSASTDNRFVVQSVSKALGYTNVICVKYPSVTPEAMTSGDKCIRGSEANTDILIKDSSFTDAASFKAAMSGVMLVYELATPTTEQADPFQEVQICDASGTEEFVTTSIVPVGHVTKYYDNLRQKLEDLPAIPSVPSDNGTYTLKVTVADGVPTLSWVK